MNEILYSSLTVTHNTLVTKATPIGYIDSKYVPYKEADKQYRTCLIGYSGFNHVNGCHSQGADTHMHAYQLPR